MKHVRKALWGRVVAIALALTLLLVTSAGALTPDQLKMLLKEYYLGEITDAVLSRDSIDAILKELGDPYTQYLTAKEYQDLLGGMSDQELGGIGISVRGDARGLYIIEALASNPAASAGLITGDIIIEIDGKSCANQDVDLLVAWLRGEEGSIAKIKVLHANGSTSEHSVRRSLVELPLVKVEKLDDYMTYIDSIAFGEQTTEHFIRAAQSYPDTGLWLIDMRTNPGGEVQATADTLGVFLGRVDVVYLKDARDDYKLFVSQQDALSKAPAIVLTSGYSASAAEIFSGTLRDAKRALLIGERTYGKGVAQSILDKQGYPEMFLDDDALTVTSDRYYLGISSSTADQIGIMPHLLVPANQAKEVARLLSERAPIQEQQGSYLRMQLAGRVWYVNLESATADKTSRALLRLLEALPPHANLSRSSAQGTWTSVTPASVANEYELGSFTSRYFTDLTGRADMNAINTLATYDIVRGDSGKFRPEDSLTRAELCALLVQALQLQLATKPTSFQDVSAGAWYKQEVEAVVGAGLMNGRGDGNFAPEDKVTVEEMITVLARAATSINAILYETNKDPMPSQTGIPADFSEWSRKWAWILAESQTNGAGSTINLLHTAPSQVKAKAEATRAQTALTLYNILVACALIEG